MSILHKSALITLSVICLAPAALLAEPAATENSALARMPVKEITVFKDGHALVVHEGRMATDGAGNVQLDYLPIPVLGTFWPYAQPNGPKLAAVVASPRRVKVPRTALSIKEMIESNTGSKAQITEVNNKKYEATILGIPQRSSQELERSSPPDSGDRLPEKADVVLLKTSVGTQVLPLNRIQDVTFAGAYHPTVSAEEFRNLLTLKLDWSGQQRGRSADVGMMYLQKGIRWIPSYKVSIDGKGSAVISLQATLVNEMTDLSDVTANLVIGVPSFYFQDQVDPISLQQTVAQLSSYFATNSPTRYALSNGIMGQAAGPGGGGFNERTGASTPGSELGPDVAGSAKNEDLFVFTVHHITLKKGQRMTMPVNEMTMKYRDVYTVDLPFAPPREMRGSGPGSLSEQQMDLFRAANMPKAEHRIRLVNSTHFPLTTAPALIMSGGKVIAQAQMTYTAAGSDTDLRITTAVDVKVKKRDQETARIQNAGNWDGRPVSKINLAGSIAITNFGAEPAYIEVTRNVLGNVDKADHDGVAVMVNVLEDDAYAPTDYQYPPWWGSFSWPGWWYHFNGVGRVTWKLTLDPTKSTDLTYTWNYYWQ